MNQRSLPKTILPIELADKRAVLQGEIPLKEMPRLADTLLDNQGAIEIELHFGKDAEGQRFVIGQIKGEVLLACQRCLQPVDFALNLKTKLGIVLSDTAAEHLAKEYEPLLVSTDPVALVDIIEEELLLGLPIVAKHPEGACPVASSKKQKTH